METKQAFILIIEDDNGYREIPLGYSVYSIGKSRKSDIRLFSIFVSKRHATLVRRFHDDGSLYYKIVDGNLKGKLSANGLLINGKKLQTHHLENGDKIVFGSGVLAKYDIRNITAIEPMRTDDEQYIFMGLMLFNDE